MPHDQLIVVSPTDPTPKRTPTGASIGDAPIWDGTTYTPAPAGGGAPTGADYLVGTAQGGLSAEIVVGATPGGELSGTWASPTVDATHSGSTHAATQAAAEATAAAALSVHTGDTSDAHDASAVSIVDAGTFFTGTEVEAALQELGAAAFGGGSAPSNADYLVGTASGALSAEIVVGTTPGGELGGTWASPTVDATHSGSAHHSHPKARARRVSGNISLNSTSWADVDNGLDLTVASVAGDVLLVVLSAQHGSEAVTGALDAATIVSAAPVNYVSLLGGAGDFGVMGWLLSSGFSAQTGTGVQYVVQAGDISSGNVVLRLRYRTSAAVAKTLAAGATAPLQWSVVNLRQ